MSSRCFSLEPHCAVGRTIGCPRRHRPTLPFPSTRAHTPPGSATRIAVTPTSACLGRFVSNFPDVWHGRECVSLTHASPPRFACSCNCQAPPPSGGGCFPAHARVLLDTGDYVRMDELQTGQKVLATDPLSGDPVFSEVFQWLHYEVGVPKKVDAFISMETESGHVMSTSPQHWVVRTDAAPGCLE